MAEPRVTTHHPGDFHLMGYGISPTWGGRYVGGTRGHGGDPVVGDVLVVGSVDVRSSRWEVTAVDYPYREHHPDDHTAAIWVASVRPAPSLFRLV